MKAFKSTMERGKSLEAGAGRRIYRGKPEDNFRLCIIWINEKVEVQKKRDSQNKISVD